MPRRRQGTVSESQEHLEALARAVDGEPARRLRLLLAIKKNPSTTMDELSIQIGSSVRNMQRWWSKYRKHGLNTLVPELPPIGSILERSQPPHAWRPTGDEHRQRHVSQQMAQFLNALPTTFDCEEWTREFSGNLKRILDGVDRVTLRVNLASEIDHPDDEPADLIVIDRESGGSARNGARQRMRTGTVTTTPGRLLVAQMLAENFPGSMYQIPVTYDYYLGGTEYVGSIVLWRERSHLPIPASTLDLMKTLHPFITFALSDCVSRHIKTDPDLRHFQHIINKLAVKLRLTPRELEVFTQQLAGVPRKTIARNLNIALCTVAKHISGIHAKTGTKNYTELFAGWKPEDE